VVWGRGAFRESRVVLEVRWKVGDGWCWGENGGGVAGGL